MSSVKLLDFKAAGFFPTKPKWTADNIPDLNGKVAMVTGANVGLGKQTAKSLLSKGAKVYALCRSKEKAEAAIKEIKEETGKDDIHFVQCDLSDIPSAINAGKTIAKTEQRLDIVILSAGVMFPPKGSKSAQGLELQFATNVVGHFALVRELQELLISTASKEDTKPASVRVVWVSSSAHFALMSEKQIPFKNVTDNITAHTIYTYYGISKLGNIQMANAMASRLSKHNILVLSLHPGNIKTELQRHTSAFEKIFINPILHPVTLGALTQLYAATSTDLTMDDSGAYFVPWAQKYRPSNKIATDSKAYEETFAEVEKIIEKYSKL